MRSLRVSQKRQWAPPATASARRAPRLIARRLMTFIVHLLSLSVHLTILAPRGGHQSESWGTPIRPTSRRVGYDGFRRGGARLLTSCAVSFQSRPEGCMITA